MKKKIAILGITGSIGLSAVDVIKEHSDKFEICFASANNSFKQLMNLAVEFNIPEVNLTNHSLSKKNIEIPTNVSLSFGEESLLKKLDELKIDIVLNGIAGSAGLRSSIKTIEKGYDLALANKESMVMAGHIINELLETSNTKILPVDSEHSAIFQLIHDKSVESIKNLTLTASGGSFRDYPLDDFDKISIKEALNHPTWSMGKKITIDSATMFNKGLEVIEAHWLYNVAYDKIKAVIHPQSIIHSLVEFIDGSFTAQLSNPSMKLPILYAFSHPNRFESNLVNTDIFSMQNLTFKKVDSKRYPLFDLCLEAGNKGGLFPTILNASNEAAVQLFLDGKIKFVEIYPLVNAVMQVSNNIKKPDLETILKSNIDVYNKTYREYEVILNN